MQGRLVTLSVIVLLGCTVRQPSSPPSLGEVKAALSASETGPRGTRELVSSDSFYGCDYVPDTTFFGPLDGRKNMLLVGMSATAPPISFLFAYCRTTGEAIWLTESAEGVTRLFRQEGITAHDETSAYLVMSEAVYLTSAFRYRVVNIDSPDDLFALADGQSAASDHDCRIVGISRDGLLTGTTETAYAGTVYVHMEGDIYERRLRLGTDMRFTYSDHLFRCGCDAAHSGPPTGSPREQPGSESVMGVRER